MMIADIQLSDRVDQMPSFNHSYICSQILSQLFQNQAIFPMPELTLDIGNGVTPDISVYPIDQVHPNLFRDIPRFPQMPILAIEVVSASQNIQDLLEKAADLIQAGVKTVWTVEPFSRTVFVTDERGDTVFHNPLLEAEGVKVDFRRIFGSERQSQSNAGTNAG